MELFYLGKQAWTFKIGSNRIWENRAVKLLGITLDR